MIQFVKDIKNMFDLSKRLAKIENDIKVMKKKENQLIARFAERCKEVIKDSSTDYITDINDARKDYLKKYMDVVLGSLTSGLESAHKRIDDLTKKNKKK